VLAIVSPDIRIGAGALTCGITCSPVQSPTAFSWRVTGGEKPFAVKSSLYMEDLGIAMLTFQSMWEGWKRSLLAAIF
jgi:hypothetical protein